MVGVSNEITTIADVIRVHAAQRPDAAALVVDDRAISYAELDERSSRTAQALRAAGVGPGDRVVFLEKNGAELFEVTFGLAKLGAVCVPVNWRLAPPEMLQIISDARARVIVVGSEFFGHIEAIEDRLTEVGTVVAVGAHQRWPSFRDWIGAHPAEDPHIAVTAEDVGLQLYTSGTTGLPKGVMLTNRNMFGHAAGITAVLGLTSESVNLAVMPGFHIAGVGWTMFALHSGCTNVIMRDVDPAAILQAIPQYGITHTFLVPAVISFLMMMPGVEEVDFSTLRTIIYGASPITDDALRKALALFGCEFIQVYGATETTGAITQLDGADHDPDNRPGLLRSCGKPYPWVQIRVVDANGDDVADGAVGELWVRSPSNMSGYWNAPDATAATITGDGWLKTGDAGYFDAEGYLYLHDRVKDMIVSGGENVYPAEVENVLAAHSDVDDVAVIGVPHEKWGEAVLAVVVPAAGASPSEAELIAFARERLAGFKLPKSFAFVDALPRNPSGKVLKRELREPYWAEMDRGIS